jgi:hypothetical protein
VAVPETCQNHATAALQLQLELRAWEGGFVCFSAGFLQPQDKIINKSIALNRMKILSNSSKWHFFRA